jgi:hypothetical protein
MDIGFVILCPDHNFAGLKNSIGSIRHHCYDREYIGVVGSDATADDIKVMKEICPIHKGKATITSLVNVGMKKVKHDWAFIMFGGSRVCSYLERRFTSFVKSDKDILYPVVDRKCNFVEGCFNGVLINVPFFKEVGDFPEMVAEKQDFNDFEMAKLFWATDAIAQGAQFKGIVGMRII